MNILALDTSETRGSIAFLRDREATAVRRHEGDIDYSEWLLPAVEELLREARARIDDVELLGVSTGPGSFTGLRVGLTTAKAWAEVYGKPIVGVSRLEAMARSVKLEQGLVAAYYDAHRGQVFAGLYRRLFGQVTRVGDEVVIPPEGFLEFVEEHAGADAVKWISLDPEVARNLVGWDRRERQGDRMHRCEPELATAIGRFAEERARTGELSNPRELDANYVRRSDAEIFWKGR